MRLSEKLVLGFRGRESTKISLTFCFFVFQSSYSQKVYYYQVHYYRSLEDYAFLKTRVIVLCVLGRFLSILPIVAIPMMQLPENFFLIMALQKNHLLLISSIFMTIKITLAKPQCTFLGKNNFRRFRVRFLNRGNTHVKFSEIK